MFVVRDSSACFPDEILDTEQLRRIVDDGHLRNRAWALGSIDLAFSPRAVRKQEKPLTPGHKPK